MGITKHQRRIVPGIVFALFAICSPSSRAQTGLRPPVQFTAEQDYRNMLEQMGLTAMRSGPSGDVNAPNHANYDEQLANPYPRLPEVLRLNNGTPVTTAQQWQTQRRPELLELFSREVYGFVPKDVPRVSWAVVANERENVSGIEVIARQLVGHVDNSAYPRSM